jgi:hypothetical protein
MSFDIKSKIVLNGDKHTELWLGPDISLINDDNPRLGMMFLTTDRYGHDSIGKIIYAEADLEGNILTEFSEPPSLQPREFDESGTESVFNKTAYHHHSGKILAIGGLTIFDDTIIREATRCRRMVYAIYDPASGNWSDWLYFDPPGAVFGSKAAVHPSPQFSIEENGDVIVPYTWLREGGSLRHVGTVRCSFDGKKLIPVQCGTFHTIPFKRGLLEPMIIRFGKYYYMTIRAENGRGYHSISEDGINWEQPEEWRWNNGEVIAMNTTMTRFIQPSGRLALVYTRICENNHNVIRNRAPLFTALVDPIKRQLIRESETIIFPNKGLPMGNFNVNPGLNGTWYISVGEWDRTGNEKNGDCLMAIIK